MRESQSRITPEKISQIGGLLIARGANRNLVRGIVSDRRLSASEKVFLLADIYDQLRGSM